jgi:hypothetical protein
MTEPVALGSAKRPYSRLFAVEFSRRSRLATTG